jgi:tetratricopeptide (TPR) repeat protein
MLRPKLSAFPRARRPTPLCCSLVFSICVTANRSRPHFCWLALQSCVPATSSPAGCSPWALNQSDQAAAATTAFEAALALKPPRVDLAEIHRDYAERLQRQRQPDKALQVWQRLEQAFPGDRRVLRQVARALARDGRWADALTRFEQPPPPPAKPKTALPPNLKSREALQQLERSKESLTRLQSLLPELDPAAWLYRDVCARIEQLYPLLTEPCRSRAALRNVADRPP